MEKQEFTSSIEIDSWSIIMELKEQTSGGVVAAMSWTLAKRDGSDSYVFDIDKIDTANLQDTSKLIIDFIDRVQKTSDRRFAIELKMSIWAIESQYSELALFLKDLSYIDKFVIIGNKTDGTRRLVLVCEGF